MNRMFTTTMTMWDLAARVGNGLSWLPPAVARVTVGWVFFQSGWGKLHDLEKVTEFFVELGLPVPGFQAALVSTTELVCGALLLAGLATRFAAFPLMVTMVVALRTALWEQIDSLGSLFGLSEFLYIALLLWLATSGAGPLSIDWLIDRARQRTAAPASFLRRISSAIA